MRQERLKREQEKPLPQQNKWEPRPLVEQPLKWVAPFSLALFSSTQLHWSDPAQEIIRVLKTVLQHNLIGSKYLSFAPSLRTEEKQRSIWTTSQYSLHLTQWSLLLLLRSPWARLRWTEAKTGILMIDWLVRRTIHQGGSKQAHYTGRMDIVDRGGGVKEFEKKRRKPSLSEAHVAVWKSMKWLCERTDPHIH